jgi:hypothetical protein
MENKEGTYNLDLKTVSGVGYAYSHIIAALLITFCLKKYNSVLLTILLSLILAYMSYEAKDKFPIYTLIVFGVLVYVINMIVVDEYSENELLSTKIQKSLWKIPFWGIISYYVMYGRDTYFKYT